MSIMAEVTYHKSWPRRGLSTTNIRLENYSKEPIAVVGSTNVQVSYAAQLPLVVERRAHPPGKKFKIKLDQNPPYIQSGFA